MCLFEALHLTVVPRKGNSHWRRRFSQLFFCEELTYNEHCMVNHRRQRASAVILKDKKVLLIRRIKSDQDYYVFPGGGVDEGESIKDALIREVKEELNLDVKEQKLIFSIEDLSVPPFVTIHKGSRDEHYFLVENFTGLPQFGGPEKDQMNEQNQYHIEWIELGDMSKYGNIYPRDGVNKLLNYFKSKNSQTNGNKTHLR